MYKEVFARGGFPAGLSDNADFSAAFFQALSAML